MRALFLLLLLIASPAAAADADWSRARTVEVRLVSFGFKPDRLRLRAGEPVVLRLVNRGGRGHDFSAPQFFALAAIEPSDRAQLRGGTIEVPKRQTREIRLVPERGRYRLRSTRALNAMLGMRGEILVE